MGATDGCEKASGDWESKIGPNVQEDESPGGGGGRKGREIVPLRSQAVPLRLHWSGYGPVED